MGLDIATLRGGQKHYDLTRQKSTEYTIDLVTIPL
jgi:hypothetical protein